MWSTNVCTVCIHRHTWVVCVWKQFTQCMSFKSTRRTIREVRHFIPLCTGFSLFRSFFLLISFCGGILFACAKLCGIIKCKGLMRVKEGGGERRKKERVSYLLNGWLIQNWDVEMWGKRMRSFSATITNSVLGFGFTLHKCSKMCNIHNTKCLSFIMHWTMNTLALVRSDR